MGIPRAGREPLSLSLSLSLSLGLCRIVAANNRFEQPQGIFVLNSFFQNRKQNSLIHTVKEFSNIALQSKARFLSVFAYAEKHFLKRIDSFMRAITNAARKRRGNKRWFKYGIQHRKNRVVQNAVADRGFVDVTLFRIGDVKTSIWSVLVRFIFQFAMQVENILLQTPFKFHHIALVPLITPKSVPS